MSSLNRKNIVLILFPDLLYIILYAGSVSVDLFQGNSAFIAIGFLFLLISFVSIVYKYMQIEKRSC